jgi:segregation and condensation protein B
VRCTIEEAPFSIDMSLKAKIEAVIYAAEEPVTLAQIAALFQTELLEERQARLNAEPAVAVESDPEEPAFALEGPPVQSGLSAEIVAADAPGFAADEEKRAARRREREVREEARRIVVWLIAEYGQGDRGVEIREIAGGYRVATKPEYHDAVRGFIKSLKPPMKLSLQALETLAVIAYKQPVTAPEVSEIRGVDSSGVLGSLVSRKLITTAGRKQVIGRPILYKTTKEFLLRFGLKDLNELPSIEEFEKMAGELAETEGAVPASELPFENRGAAIDDPASDEAEPEIEGECAGEGNG